MKLKGNEWAVTAAAAELTGAKRIASAAKILHAANTKKKTQNVDAFSSGTTESGFVNDHV